MRLVNPALLTPSNIIAVGMMLLFLVVLIWGATAFFNPTSES